MYYNVLQVFPTPEDYGREAPGNVPVDAHVERVRRLFKQFILLFQMIIFMYYFYSHEFKFISTISCTEQIFMW